MNPAPHRRRNLLTGRWVLVSPHRAARPWQGDATGYSQEKGPAYDASCYLCPGNARASGERNPNYSDTFVFDNDFPALLPTHSIPRSEDRLLVASPARGCSRVICYSPDHALTLADMDRAAVVRLLDTWSAQTIELSAQYACVQVFENKGAMMGCSSPHPHGQIWASDFIPTEVADEDREQARWFAEHGEALLGQYADRELAAEERVIAARPHWLALVPWWAAWPFEVLLIARHPIARLDALTTEARDEAAEMLLLITRGYDALFGVSFPYSMGWHQAPGNAPSEHWRLHAHFYPPLLRSPTIRKFMVGYELLAEVQRDLTAEAAAAQLRDAIAAVKSARA